MNSTLSLLFTSKHDFPYILPFCRLPASMFIDNESALFTVEETVSESTRQASDPTGNESSFLKTNGSDVEKMSIGNTQMKNVKRTIVCFQHLLKLPGPRICPLRKVHCLTSMTYQVEPLLLSRNLFWSSIQWYSILYFVVMRHSGILAHDQIIITRVPDEMAALEHCKTSA